MASRDRKDGIEDGRYSDVGLDDDEAGPYLKGKAFLVRVAEREIMAARWGAVFERSFISFEGWFLIR